MHTTRNSLLLRVRDRDNQEAWADFHSLYAPLIYGFARARGLSNDDAEEVRSACYETIVRQIADFEYDKDRGRFRSWLRTIVDRRIADQFRQRRPLNLDSRELAGIPDSDDADSVWDEQWQRHHLEHCVAKARMLVSQTTYSIFCMLVDEGHSVADVCASRNVNANQVYKAKSQMLARVREVMETDFPDGF